MAQALIKFRCYRCGKLLGTAPTKAGLTTACPNCKAELIVPDPEETAEASIGDDARNFLARLDDRPPAAMLKPARGHDPTFSWEELDTSLFRPEAAPGSPDSAGVPADGEPTISSPDPVAPPPTGLPGGAGLPEIEVEIAPVRPPRMARARSGEVVLSQAVIGSWSAFVLLALAVSFVAGLFVGHFVWKGR